MAGGDARRGVAVHKRWRKKTCARQVAGPPVFGPLWIRKRPFSALTKRGFGVTFMAIAERFSQGSAGIGPGPLMPGGRFRVGFP